MVFSLLYRTNYVLDREDDMDFNIDMVEKPKVIPKEFKLYPYEYTHKPQEIEVEEVYMQDEMFPSTLWLDNICC